MKLPMKLPMRLPMRLPMIKRFLTSILIFTVVALQVSRPAFAGVSDELESLGSNPTVLDRANQLENRTRVGIVQGRVVDRDMRFELGAAFGPTAYGDAYLVTNNVVMRGDFHITPRWSLGLQYSLAYNQLTSEARLRFEQARVDSSASIPQVVYPEESLMAVLNWYMIYGKLNLFDWRTVQFDIYSLAGVGQIKLSTDLRGQTITENNSVMTAGLGIGFWFTQHLSLRLEGRYQRYADRPYSGERIQNQGVGTIGFGALL